MSTIRRHGVAFHLLPTPTGGLWLEVVRESDGAVLVTEEYSGEGDSDFAATVEQWLDELVLETVSGLDIEYCRLCQLRRRQVRYDDLGLPIADYLVEWEFALCLSCASHMEQTTPWIRRYLCERYLPEFEPDED